MKLLAGKTALITGGSDGIGLGIAEAFAEQGANLILVARDAKKLTEREKELSRYGTDHLVIGQDMAARDAAREIAGKVAEKHIRIDILVNNAGIGRFIPFADSDASVLDFHLDLNVRAPYLLTRIFLNDLIASQGNVINISSYFARRMLPDRPSTAYSLTKGALESFTKALAFELGPQGVRVNAIAPGTVATPQVKTNIDLLADDDAKERFKSMITTIYPLQSIGEPQDVGNMCVFLASEQAKWITGGIFPVDGGLTTN